MAKEKVQLPSAVEVAAWIKGLGIKESFQVIIKSDLERHDGYESYTLGGGYYDGVTKGSRVKLYSRANSLTGEKEKRWSIPSKTISSIEKPKPIDWSREPAPRMYFGPV